MIDGGAGKAPGSTFPSFRAINMPGDHGLKADIPLNPEPWWSGQESDAQLGTDTPTEWLALSSLLDLLKSWMSPELDVWKHKIYLS